jgi:5S rRNA maturation endonuclease (ribonuclease M5)
LSTHMREKEEKITKILEALAEEAADGRPIVVEGKKDLEALHTLGIQGVILTAKTGGKSLLDVIYELEQLGPEEAILLLDFDRRGKEGTANLKEFLERGGIRTNMKYWRQISALLGREIQSVESLTAYLATLRTKINSTTNGIV